jgi:hypothetical protein
MCRPGAGRDPEKKQHHDLNAQARLKMHFISR